MGLFDVFKMPDINGMAESALKDGAQLIDVRTPEEYAQGHISGSINIPLDTLPQGAELIRGKQSKIYVYCRSGARSGRAAALLRRYGYSDVTNIGGIINYKGTLTLK